MATLMTQAEFAARRGVGKPAVSNWKKAGLLVFAEGTGGKLLVDAERSEARLNARVDPSRGRPTTAMNSGDAPELPMEASDEGGGDAGGVVAGRGLAKVRAEVAEEDLVAKRLKNAELARELVPAMEAERRCQEIGRMARERVQAEEYSIVERLAVERDPRVIRSLLDEARDRAFHALADAVQGGALEEDEGEDIPQAASA